MTKGVRYISLYENSGYGVAGKSYLRALIRAGVNVSWTPLVPRRGLSVPYAPFDGVMVDDPLLNKAYRKEIEYDIVIVHTFPELFSYWCEKERSKCVIGYTVWETSKPPNHWPELINQVDHLMVPTEWNRQIFKNHGVTIPIEVIPHLSEFEGKPIQDPGRYGIKNDRYLFYVISTWTVRKVIPKLVRAFQRTFASDESVELFIKTSEINTTKKIPKWMRRVGFSYPPVRKEFQKLMRQHPNSPPITLVDDDTKPPDYIRALHTAGDCYVSLCRSEGWGIGAFEAAYFGKPVIMTGFGGHTDYLHPDLSWLVGFDLVPVKDPNAPKSYDKDQNWAEPDISQASNFMRQVFENQAKATEIGKQLQSYVKSHFSNEVTTEKLTRFLKSL